MISRIEARGYRCFPKLSIDLDRYQVIAGANGAGKTTLLDIPVLLGDMLRQQPIAAAFLERQAPDKAARAGTFLDVPFRGREGTVAFALEARLPVEVIQSLQEHRGLVGELAPTHARYELLLSIGARNLHISAEHLFLFSEHGHHPLPGDFSQGWPRGGSARPLDLPHPDWLPVIIRRTSEDQTLFIPEGSHSATDIPPLRLRRGHLGLGTVPADPTLFPAALWLAQLLRGGVVPLTPDWEALRHPAPPGDPARMITSGRNMPWLALDLEHSDPESFSSWIDHVRTALPQVRNITAIERDEDHHAYFAVDHASGYRVTSSGLSGGTLRILAFTLLPFLSSTVMPTLLVVEEPENGIHPRAIETVTQSLSSLFDSQVWVSTHSPVVLANTRLADVLAARVDGEGGVDVVRGDQHPRLRGWQGTLDVGTLVAAGILA